MTKILFVSFVILALLRSSVALYGSNSAVVKLDSKNFRSMVSNSQDMFMVEFYAPWCGHCKQLAPQYEKAAKALKGIIGVGAVDMTTDESVGRPFGIQGFPTLKLFMGKGQKPIDYNGQRTADAIVDFVLNEARKAAKGRLSGRGGSRSRGGSRGGSRSGGSRGGAGGDPVVVLTDQNFDEMVLQSDDLWFIEFYAPWCGHCKKLLPEFEQVGRNLQKRKGVRLGKVDCTVEKGLGQRFQVQGYPTIKLFPKDAKRDRDAQAYNGGRDARSLEDFVLSKLGTPRVELEVKQMLNEKDFNTYCKEFEGICFVAFLPHIYDSSAEERNKYIKWLQTVQKSNSRTPICFLWSQGGDQFEMEEAFGMSFGYPALMAMSHSKQKYSVMRGSFSERNIKRFVLGLMAGKERLQSIQKMPREIRKVSAWDGKDKQPERLDEYDDLDDEPLDSEMPEDSGCDGEELCKKPEL